MKMNQRSDREESQGQACDRDDVENDLEKVIEQLHVSNAALRQERNAALDRAEKLSQRCAESASEIENLRRQLDKIKEELELRDQQCLNEWKQRKSAEESLIKLKAKLSRDKHSLSKTQLCDPEIKDTAANLHVSGSGLGTEVRAREVSRLKDRDLDLERQKTVDGRSQKSSVRGHVTAAESETVTSLPETLLRIRREKSTTNSVAMLSATYPPPRTSGHVHVKTGSGHGVTELGRQQPCLDVSGVPVRSTLQLPRISHRTSSS